MIIFILVIHAGGAKGRAVCAAENVFSPSSPAPPPSEWGSLLSSRGVASFQEWNPFRGTHFLGVWTYCEVSVMSGTESTEAGSSTQRNIKNLSEEDIKGANNQKASFLPSSNYKGGFWSFACGVMNRGRDEDCFTFLSFFLFFFFFICRGGRKRLFTSSCSSRQQLGPSEGGAEMRRAREMLQFTQKTLYICFFCVCFSPGVGLEKCMLGEVLVRLMSFF